MEYTFPTPAIRRTVRETHGASFANLDENADSWSGKVSLSHPGSRIATSNPILEIASAEGYSLVGGRFVLSRDFPADSDYAGEKYPGHLEIDFESGEAIDSNDLMTTGDVLAAVDDVVDHTRERGDHTQFRIDVEEEAETIDIGEPIQILQMGGVRVVDVTATEGAHGGSSNVFILVSFDEPDPFEMPGISEREKTTLHRHEALVLVQALEQYEGDRNTGHLKSKLVSEHNLERYLQYLD